MEIQLKSTLQNAGRVGFETSRKDYSIASLDSLFSWLINLAVKNLFQPSATVSDEPFSASLSVRYGLYFCSALLLRTEEVLQEARPCSVGLACILCPLHLATLNLHRPQSLSALSLDHFQVTDDIIK